MIRITIVTLTLSFFVAPSPAHADGDPLFQEIQALVTRIDNAVAAADFTIYDEVLAADCVGKSTITPRQECWRMYQAEIGSILDQCAADPATTCDAGRFLMEHRVLEVSRMTDGEVWSWIEATFTDPKKVYLRHYTAMNIWTNVAGNWKMRRILLIRD
jgi:hypothetical protein